MEADGAPVVEVHDEERANSIVDHVDGDRLAAHEQAETPARKVRREQVQHAFRADAGLEGKPRYPAVARVEIGGAAGRSRLAAIVIAKRVAQGAVARRAAEGLDVLVLVEGRDALRAELSAEPVGLFEQAGAATATRGSQRRRDPAHAAAGDQHVAFDLASRRRVIDRQHGDVGITGHGHPHHVDHLGEPTLHPTYLVIVLGNQSAICGKAMTSPRAMSCSTMYGMIERKMSPRLMSGGTTPLR